MTANLTTGGVPYKGPGGIARYLEDVEGVWPQLRIYPEELRDLGEVVVALGRVLARGGGMIIDQPTGWVFRMRSGRIFRAHVYATQEEALAAARNLKGTHGSDHTLEG